jgi:hypothetical protein
VLVNDEVDRQRERAAVIDQHHPTQLLAGQRLEALLLGQLLPANLPYTPRLPALQQHPQRHRPNRA